MTKGWEDKEADVLYRMAKTEHVPGTAIAAYIRDRYIPIERIQAAIELTESYLGQSNLTESDKAYAQGCKAAFTGLIHKEQTFRPRLIRGGK